MHRFYGDEATLREDTVCLQQEDAQHCLRVLRLTVGDEAEVYVGGRRYAAKLLSAEGNNVTMQLLSEKPSTEPKTKITLFQGLPKGDKMELIIQKAVEIGVTEIVPVEMTRSVVRLSGKDGEKKRERWQKIAREATKQSARAIMPTVCTPVKLKDAMAMVAKDTLSLVAWEEEHTRSLTQIHEEYSEVRSIAIWIGPEGGIDEKEIAQLMAETNAQCVTLGPRILRTETAGLVMLANLLCLWGDMA